MALIKLSILALMGLTLAACQEEAGFDARFPAVGGAPVVSMPDAGMPTDLTPTDPAAGETTESLTNAVNEALSRPFFASHALMTALPKSSGRVSAKIAGRP